MCTLYSIPSQTAVTSMIVYPNKMDFPVMENFGIEPLPLGMVEVTIHRAEGLPVGFPCS